ncbi:MAG: tetratricopeptide repeat protein [Deltaproteobacteria bacterium]|nr:MAG: tetratricopeptide repeat protein [Deltaproteobacteria bacterium]
MSDDHQPGSNRDGAPPSLRRPDAAAADGFPPRLDAPAGSNLRKEQVRAALFRKLEPVRVGRFILLEPLGAGAMGEIYAAYDDQLDRKVALKLVRSGSEIKGDERLLREAQTLAQVSHPNVVQIYEAGTYNGRLFIAMELVRGKTLTSWLRDAAQLPRSVRRREILRQFLAAGRGLEAAHAAGVAHRDFKPDNVLVGDDGRVRVVDFGLARAMVDDAQFASSAPLGGDQPAQPAQPGTPRSREDIGSGPTEVLDGAESPTGAGLPRRAAPPGDNASSIPVMTGASTIDHEPVPARIAPSRGSSTSPAKPGAARRGGSAAPGKSGTVPSRSARTSSPRLKAALRLTRTGTVLGTPCFMAPEQMRGAVADPRSDQFSFCVALYYALYGEFPFSGQSLRELRDSMDSEEIEFASGAAVPAFVRKALARGLAVDPARRFAGMTDLLVALAPRSRRRGWLAAAAAVVALSVGAAAYLQSQAQEPCAAAGLAIHAAWSADRQVAMHAAFVRGGLPFAASAWRGVKTQIDGYASQWRADATAACQDTHVAHTQSAEQLDRRMLCLDRGRRELAALVSELGTGAPDAVEHAVEAAGALPESSACSHAEHLLFGVSSPPAAIVADVARARDRLAQASTLELLGRYDDSLAIAREVTTITEHLGYPSVHAEALAQTARALNGRNTVDVRAEVQKLYFDALAIAEAERHDQLAFEIWSKLVRLAVRMDSSMVQAHAWWDQAHAWWQRNASTIRGGDDGAMEQAALHYMLGDIYFRESEYSKAAGEERRAIALQERAPGHQLELSRYYGALADSLERLDELDEARRLHEQALSIAIEALGASHPHVIELQINYAKTLEKCNQLERAYSVLEGVLDSMSTRDRESHPDAALAYSFLSGLEYLEGHLDLEAEHGQASLRIYQRTQASNHVRIAQAYTNLANVEMKRRNFSNALALYEDALAIRRGNLGANHYQIGVNEGSIAEALLGLERYHDAMVHLVDAERIFQRGSSHERGTRAWMLTIRGEILVGQRQFGASLLPLEQALELFSAQTADPSNHALAMWTLARALHGLGKDDERVRALAESAQAVFGSQGAVGAHDREMIARFLEQLRTSVPPGSPAGALPGP